MTKMKAKAPSEVSSAALAYLGDCVIEYSPALTARLDDFDMDMEDDSIRKRWGGLQIYRVLLESAEFTEGEFALTVRRK